LTSQKANVKFASNGLVMRIISRNGSPNPPMIEPIIKTPTDARTGSKEGVVRYVLGISIALVVICFIAAYLIR
jgi:hypothetical protein